MAISAERASPHGPRLALSVLLALSALWMSAIYCGQISRTSVAPASSLVLSLELRQGADLALSDKMIVMVTTYATVGPACSTPSASVTPPSCPVSLGGHQTLTVNGAAFPTFGDPDHSSPGADAVVARQPPGGAYTFVYTDERGQQTHFTVPAPNPPLSVTSPASGATVPIPAGPTERPTATPPGDRAADLISQPLVIRYTLPSFPDGATVTATGSAECGDPNGEADACGDLRGAAVPAKGEYTLTDANTAYGYGFETFEPGPGSVWISLFAQWTSASSGFASLQVTLTDDERNIITWGER